MSHPARETLLAYLGAQSAGDVEGALRLISTDAVFDVGRGRYEGDAVRAFLERLRTIRSVTTAVTVDVRGPAQVVALLEQRDDDLSPLGIESIQLEVDVRLDADGRISHFTARPTEASLARLAAARDAGRRSEGVDLAERAGTLPPSRGK